MDYNVYVISAGRYDKLPFTSKEKKEYIFCVKVGEKELYEQNGCFNVFETGKLMQSRNWALDHAFGQNKICVQLSDDIKWVKLNKNFSQEAEKIPLENAIKHLVDTFNKVPVKLMGIPPTANDFYAKNLISKNTFCIGDAIFIKPTDLRFDENLTLKEDYDFTLQVLQKYGHCFRYQKYLFYFQHYSNPGGAVDIRNEKEETKNITYLLQKWGTDKIKLNPKRKNEILLVKKKYKIMKKFKVIKNILQNECK